MKVVFLGTNGWYDTPTGNTICTLIESKSFYLILDAGNGIYKADKYIHENKPVYLFLSHFHLDHIIGLHVLVKFAFKSLSIYGQPGTKKVLSRFLSPAFSMPLKRLGYPCDLHDIREGWHDRPFRFRCLKLKHASTCFGYRFEFEDKIISYCTDTGVCPEAVELSRGADLLISECAFVSGQQDKNWPHLNPETSAGLAAKAKAKKMSLVHFDAHAYQTFSAREAAGANARKIFRNTIIARDNLTIHV